MEADATDVHNGCNSFAGDVKNEHGQVTDVVLRGARVGTRKPGGSNGYCFIPNAFETCWLHESRFLLVWSLLAT